jgi:hypothetical protein
MRNGGENKGSLGKETLRLVPDPATKEEAAPMIFLTATVLGVTAVALRSVFSIVFICLMIIGAYGVAMALSSTAVPLMSLLLALAGYNFGVVGVVISLLVLQRPRSTQPTL